MEHRHCGCKSNRILFPRNRRSQNFLSEGNAFPDLSVLCKEKPEIVKYGWGVAVHIHRLHQGTKDADIQISMDGKGAGRDTSLSIASAAASKQTSNPSYHIKLQPIPVTA